MSVAVRMGRIIAADTDNGCVFIIPTKRPLAWWDYVQRHADKIVEAVGRYTPQFTHDASAAILEFDEVKLVEIAKAAQEAAADDEARAGNANWKILAEVIGIESGPS